MSNPAYAARSFTKGSWAPNYPHQSVTFMDQTIQVHFSTQHMCLWAVGAHVRTLGAQHQPPHRLLSPSSWTMSVSESPAKCGKEVDSFGPRLQAATHRMQLLQNGYSADATQYLKMTSLSFRQSKLKLTQSSFRRTLSPAEGPVNDACTAKSRTASSPILLTAQLTVQWCGFHILKQTWCINGGNWYCLRPTVPL